ncbi:GrpB family protein [Edaphobacillus lindanitolerans]|uniref:GrpB domain, predicted nucleotidyltransferase, UPF0157 family n=1 Tax=Edaphobacillus lindanitolerans TaxID=550447 RepID=A0A1U7PR68_9BACI|nr:GrpB family protein [Edaphobacillus lindanitolerans]SIT87147.1 GrpB domain, predicted nucleotidyltransferase, UPF0157 family [Edaphobacillus lindanitolerans]
MEYVSFKPESHYREAAEKLFNKQAARISAGLPLARIFHVGSTAVPGSLTKGDVDVHVRVSPEDFRKAEDFLSALFQINTGSFRSHEFCAFEDDSGELPVGFQLTAAGSEIDHFRKVTRFLRTHPDWLSAYNHLKEHYEGSEMESYRKAKSAFLESMMDAEEFLVFDEAAGGPSDEFQ